MLVDSGKDASRLLVALFESSYKRLRLQIFTRMARQIRVHSTAQIAVTAVVFVTGFGMTDAIFIMESMRKTKHLAMILSKIFRVFPAFNLGNGLIKLSFLVSWTGTCHVK